MLAMRMSLLNSLHRELPFRTNEAAPQAAEIGASIYAPKSRDLSCKKYNRSLEYNTDPLRSSLLMPCDAPCVLAFSLTPKALIVHIRANPMFANRGTFQARFRQLATLARMTRRYRVSNEAAMLEPNSCRPVVFCNMCDVITTLDTFAL